VDAQFQQIFSIAALPDRLHHELARSGFATISGPITGNSLDRQAAEYDEVMASASGPDFSVAGTTTRMSDLLNYNPSFAKIFVHPPLLDACAHVIGEPFKLSSFLGRTLRGETPSQELHADLPRDSDDAPLFGFILMIDRFHAENGATRFVPGSHRWDDLPSDRLCNARAAYPGEVLSCGDAGTMILFNGAVWHGHAANITHCQRRSIQGYFVRRNAHSGFDFRTRTLPLARTRMSPLQRYLLSLDD